MRRRLAPTRHVRSTTLTPTAAGPGRRGDAVVVLLVLILLVLCLIFCCGGAGLAAAV